MIYLLLWFYYTKFVNSIREYEGDKVGSQGAKTRSPKNTFFGLNEDANKHIFMFSNM